eukprot:3225632-Alexandrium_andersonii.AAC.1
MPLRRMRDRSARQVATTCTNTCMREPMLDCQETLMPGRQVATTCANTCMHEPMLDCQERLIPLSGSCAGKHGAWPLTLAHAQVSLHAVAIQWCSVAGPASVVGGHNRDRPCDGSCVEGLATPFQDQEVNGKNTSCPAPNV